MTAFIAVSPGANAINAKPTAPNATAPATIGITPNPAAANTKPNAVNTPAWTATLSNVAPFVALANGV